MLKMWRIVMIVCALLAFCAISYCSSQGKCSEHDCSTIEQCYESYEKYEEQNVSFNTNIELKLQELLNKTSVPSYTDLEIENSVSKEDKMAENVLFMAQTRSNTTNNLNCTNLRIECNNNNKLGVARNNSDILEAYMEQDQKCIDRYVELLTDDNNLFDKLHSSEEKFLYQIFSNWENVNLSSNVLWKVVYQYASTNEYKNMQESVQSVNSCEERFYQLEGEETTVAAVDQHNDLATTEILQMSNSVKHTLTFPIVNSASGMCTFYSSYCIDDENITFLGVDFVDNAVNDYLVNIEDATDAMCTVKATTSTSLTCTLSGVNLKKGMYIMTINRKLQTGQWSTDKREIGTLILGESVDCVGFTSAKMMVPINNTKYTVSTVESAAVTTILAIVFAIFLAIIIIVMIVICSRFKLVNKKLWLTIKKQLEDNQAEQIQLRPVVRVVVADTAN